jgi:multicomponent Na+:H+ antiporter subunit F
LSQQLEKGKAMPSFLLAIATFILAMVALGLLRTVRGPAAADRMMAAQLLGSGGVAMLLLVSVATANASVMDVALLLALLAAFASVAFVRDAPASSSEFFEAADRS